MRKSVFESIYRITKAIPFGKVTTYGEIARVLKTNPRTVGWALHANRSPKVPCHRVVDRNGRLAPNFAFDGPNEQRRRLESEGIKFKDKMHLDLKKYLWQGLTFS